MATLFGDVGQEEEPRFVQPLLGSAVFLSNLDRLGNFQGLNQSIVTRDTFSRRFRQTKRAGNFLWIFLAAKDSSQCQAGSLHYGTMDLKSVTSDMFLRRYSTCHLFSHDTPPF